MTDFERARRAMVESQLITSGISDRRLLLAMQDVPREAFVPAARRELAYVDTTHPIAGGRAMMPAATLAKLIQLAEVKHTDKVLVVGAGTGYGVAVMAKLAARVSAVERETSLAAAAREALNQTGAGGVTIFSGPPEEGLKTEAPYDVILVEGAVPEVPKALFAQLAEGGRLVAVVQNGKSGVANLFVKAGRDVAARTAFNASLPPLTVARDVAFVF